MEQQTGRPERPDKSLSLKVKENKNTNLKSEMKPKNITTIQDRTVSQIPRPRKKLYLLCRTIIHT